MKNVALIMAAGNSTRCGFDKLVAELGHQSVLQQTLQTFLTCKAVDEVWVVGKTVEPEGKLKGSITGGDSRFESVKIGLKHCAEQYSENARIIVHNAANPFLNLADLQAGLALAEEKKNVIFGFFSPNSIKKVENGQMIECLNREEIFETQTPQISDLDTFTKALKAEIKTQPRDEAELLALINEPIYTYECATSNTKITHASDFIKPESKLGLGEDSHRFAVRFEAEKPFRLGGIDVSGGTLSSDGNSDGDLILHALCNALLSAHGDKTFDPIAAPICKTGDTNSVSYLKATLAHLGKVEIDQLLISLEGAQPRIAPHHDAIVNSLTALLNIMPQQIGLTYTTGEGLSEFGKGLGMKCFVLVKLQ